MRITGSGSVYFLSDTLYDVPRPGRRLVGKTRWLSTKPGPRCSTSPRPKRHKCIFAKNFLRRMPSNTINSYRKSEEIVRRKAQSNGLED